MKDQEDPDLEEGEEKPVEHQSLEAPAALEDGDLAGGPERRDGDGHEIEEIQPLKPVQGAAEVPEHRAERERAASPMNSGTAVAGSDFGEKCRTIVGAARTATAIDTRPPARS